MSRARVARSQARSGQQGRPCFFEAPLLHEDDCEVVVRFRSAREVTGQGDVNVDRIVVAAQAGKDIAEEEAWFRDVGVRLHQRFELRKGVVEPARFRE